ncbi:MAG: helix-turn-helix transcriptional regulator [Anaerolineae bacterium]
MTAFEVLPFPEETIRTLLQTSVHAFSHTIVMDALDVSMALDLHVLVYGLEGLFQLETEQASWRLPPSRAGWIPAGTKVVASTIKPVRCISIFFKDHFVPAAPAACQIFNVSVLIREMIKYTLRWSPDYPAQDAAAERLFLTLLDLCREQMQSSSLFILPKAQSPELAAVLQYTRDHLEDDLRFDDLAKQVAMSPRTLARHFQAEIHMTWQQYLQRAQMLHAMDSLAQGQSVTNTALAVGYTNMSAFSTAFRKYTGSTPTRYQAQFV